MTEARRAVSEHSDNIEVEAGLMLIAEGNAFTRLGDYKLGDVDGVEPRHPWFEDEGAYERWSDYLSSESRSRRSLVSALGVVKAFAEHNLARVDWYRRGSPGQKSILEMSVPVFDVQVPTHPDAPLQLTMTSGVFAWDGLLLRAGDTLFVMPDASIAASPATRSIPVARCAVTELLYDTYNGGPVDEFVETADGKLLELLDPGGAIRKILKDDHDDSDIGICGFKYLSVQALNPPKVPGPIILAEVLSLEDYQDAFYDTFLVTLLDHERPLGYAMLERFVEPVIGESDDPAIDLYAPAFKMAREEIDRMPTLGESVDRLADVIRAIEEGTR